MKPDDVITTMGRIRDELAALHEHAPTPESAHDIASAVAAVEWAHGGLKLYRSPPTPRPYPIRKTG